MADVKVFTAAAAQSSLAYGRLAVANGNLYFGNASGVPVKVSNDGHTHLAADVTDMATYFSEVGHEHSVFDITDIADHYSPKFKPILVVSASRALAATDVNSILHVSGAYTLTIPASVLSAGSEITIVRTGSSTVTITAGSGVYLNGVSGGSVTITTQYKSVVLRCYSATVFYAEPVDSAYSLSTHNHDSTYLKLAGGTMTGTLYAPSVRLTYPIQNFNPFSSYKIHNSIETNLIAGKWKKLKVSWDGTERTDIAQIISDQGYGQYGEPRGLDGDSDHVLDIDFVTNGLYGSNGVTYAEGTVIFNFYSSPFPSAWSCRWKDKNGTWTTITLTKNGSSQLVGTIPAGSIYLTNIEITLSTGTGGPYIIGTTMWAICEVEYYGNRMSLSQGPLLTAIGGYIGGPVTMASALTSTVTTGTAPFVVASTTEVANLRAATATKLATARNIAGVSFDGSAAIDIPYANLTNKPTLPSGTIVGTTDTQTLTNKTLTEPIITDQASPAVTEGKISRVGTNLYWGDGAARLIWHAGNLTAGTGAANFCAGNDSRLSDARPASDVYSWAKASTKPGYNASEIGGLGASYRWLTDSYISTWNGKQDALSAGFGDSLNPYASKTAKYFLCAPNASAGSPSFRAIVASDIPTLNQSTTGSAATLTTSRTLTIGSSGKSFNGSANVSWSLDEIGAAPKFAGITTVTASRNLATSDVNYVILANSGSAIVLTIPASTFTAGSQITIVRKGSGSVTVTANGSVLFNGSYGASKAIAAQNGMISLICAATNEWYEAGV